MFGARIGLRPKNSVDRATAPGRAARGCKELFSTGVAKGRDILDSAISTSSIDGVGYGRAINGPTISSTLRFSF